MTTTELLSHLRRQNITVRADNGQIILNGPKGALTPTLRAELMQRKTEVLAFLKTAATSAQRKERSLEPVSRDGNRPLSYSQQRLWFLDQYEPNSSVYNVASAVRLKGRLDIGALEQSLKEIVKRHESLRTTFSVVEGEPVQVIAPSVERGLDVVDLRESGQNEREEQGQRICEEEARRPFDLSRGPLFRSLLIRLGGGEQILMMTLHHIVSDGWSMGVLYRELTVLYRAFCNGQPSPLPDLPIQYADYAVWQREWLKREELERQLSYWKKQLEGMPAVLNLPTDRARPAVQSFRGSRQTLELSKELTEGLRELSRQRGVTLYMTLLAAFQALLYRYTGQEDIVVGSPIANRNRTEIEGLIGFFVNTLVLRSNFSGNPSFAALLHQVRKSALEAYEHQDLPFEKLVEELKPERTLSHSPLVQVMFVLQNASATRWEFEGLSMSPIGVGAETAKFDLTLSMHEEAEGLRASLQYNTDLFDEAPIVRMMGHFRVLLEGIVADPARRLSELPILTEAERHQLLVEWNDTERDYPKDKCIHELFEEQVERSPDAAAVIFEDQQLTYRELNARANQLAHYLQELGVGPEVLVGIWMERSLEMVIALLGILKAGGAYVPLDTEYPKERLAFMLEDAKPAVLLTQKRLLEKFPHPYACIVCLDRDWGQIAKKTQENTKNKGTADNIAYVVYTSGTTGQPKGVIISHHNIGRLFRATESWFHFSKDDVWTMFHSYAFDFSVWEIWGALLYGGRLVVVPFWISRSPEKFHELICREEVTILNQTPSAFRQLIQADQSIGHRSELALRLIIFGGEALDFQTLQPWLDRHGDQCPRLVNMYGITETTVHVTYRVVKSSDVQQGVGSFIGVPLADLNLYVLDRHGQLVPIGIPGELYVGGAGVGRGYLNRPKLTDERFVLNPFSERRTGKLYKTGDLVRRLSNGDIEYLGRIDNQVKIRGFRIELGEIEAVLSQHPAVRDTVVLAREEVENSKSETENLKSAKRLIAYVVADRQVTPAITELRHFLKHKLPDYMVPSTFVFLDGMPLTPNGKIDRKALPDPDQSRPEMEESYIAPRTPVEELLAEIWAEVLKLDKVGIQDNFFELGGHSLLATQVILRARHLLEVDLPLRAFFESPTVAGLAERIEATRRKEQGLQTLPMLTVSREKTIPLSFAQQRLWFLDQYEPNSSVYNIPGALRLRGSLNVAALEQSLNEIIRRHESPRTTFSVVEGEPVQVIAPPGQSCLLLVDLSDRTESEREAEARRLAEEESRRPFDLARGPLFRTSLIRLREDDHVLVLTLHHIVSDGWSMGVLYRELTVLYRAFCNGQPSPLRRLPIQYADYAVWQREWLKREELERQLSYWKKQLEGMPAVLNLPTDRARPAVQSFRGSRQTLELSKELTEGLRELSRQRGVTLYMTLLAAFQALLYRYTGQEDIVVGSPIANRNRTEIEGLIGFFVNTLVLRSNFSGNPSFAALLNQVRKSALEAYEHQDLPFEKLVEELKPERTLSHSPLFQVMFVLQNAPSMSLTFEGLSASPERIGAGTAKFDLTLSMSETVEGLRGSLQYGSDLFDDATIARMIGHLQTLLEGIVANHDQRISDLPILTETEKHQLLIEWNSTEKDYPRDKCIHELFVTQVEKSPDAVAVTFEDQQLTYRDLNTRANQLAHYLQKLGVGPETPVGICMERSLEMIVGLLGILKAGGAYVPLDPEYPKERLGFILEDAQVSILLTRKSLIEDGRLSIEDRYPLSSVLYSQMKVVCLDRDLKEIAQQSQENPTSGITSNNVAYVIYTSGSTGKPKGVTVENRQLINYSLDIIRRLKPAAGNNFAMVQPLTVDSCVTMIFPCLLTGGALHVIYREKAISPSELGDYFRRRRIDFLKIAPSHLAALEASSCPEQFMPHRGLVIGGEESRWDWVRSLRALAPGSAVFNHYGPTETTVGVLMYRVHDEDPSQNYLKTPLGRPIANIQVFLLNARLQPVPVGILGELYVGGDNLARGYLNRPELTAERFVPNPFSVEPGARLYQTGDWARYLPDGNIEFLGRTDHQLKIRGFRIEPGEIEALLIQHPGVEQVIVTPWGETPEQQRLVAYVVPHQARAPSAAELRDFLKKKLPEYMVPSAVTLLDALPRTPHGKLDRKALPIPDQRRPEMEESYVPPRSSEEEMIVEIWAEVLKLEKVGIHDNFFELGGHSLLATQLISRLHGAFNLEIPLRALFESPTVAGLAERIEEVYRKEQRLSVRPMLPVPREKDLPLSFAQERLWFLDQLEPGNSVYNMFGAFRVSGRLDIAALERSLNEIVRRHEALRTIFRSVEGSPRQVIAAQLILPLPVIDLSDGSHSAREDKARGYAAEAARRPFDLSQGPLVRTTLLRFGEEEHVLLLSMHHIVSDGWSMAIFFRELSALYDPYVNGKASPLPDLPIQYVDYAVWQRDWLKGEVLENQLCYWRKQLEHISTLSLPTDRPRPAVQTFHGARESLLLSKDLTQALKVLSRQEGATLFMTLLAALQILLHRLTGQDDIAVGSPIAGRNRAEIESLIGFFINTLVLRAKLSGDPTFSELLARVRVICLEAYAHQDVPFEKLVEELRPERDLSRTPLFQVFLNMVNVEKRIKPAGLEIETVPMGEVKSKFDLTIYVSENNGVLRFNWVYNADLFDPDRIQEMSRQFEKLLSQISEDPAENIHSYSLLTAAAQKLLPNPVEPLASDWVGSVHDRFAYQASCLPDHPAVTDPYGSWTYAELNSQSNQLAHYLLQRGIQREEIVAVYAHRSVSLPWALLGILKAGAAFLLLDPAYPPARLIQYIRGAQPRGLISLDAAGTIPTDLERVFEDTIRCRIALPRLPQNGAGNLLERYSSEDPEIEILPDDLAYISYTSGSTGEPKGVQGRHGPLSHFLPWQAAHFGLTSSDRFSLLSGLSHDPLHREIFTALWVGATLCIPDPDLLGASGELSGWMARQRITFAHLTPALGRLLAASAKPECKIRSLRYAFFIGDKLTRRDLSGLRRLAPQVTNVNYYGSTETQRAVSYHELAPQVEDGPGGSVVPVGRGMPSAQLLILTRARKLTGIGEVGEIYMRSPHLAKGYLGDPSLTQARFITNPFTGRPDDRIYQTGDFGRYLCDGTVEVLGRIDGQINIRGFRVETGEIEFALSQCPLVRDVVVVAHEDTGGDRCLIAYVVAYQEPVPSIHELRSFLKHRLPDHMIPSAFVHLESLPLTPNAKVDRSALPAPDYTRQDLNTAPVAPRDRLELQLMQIWEKVLRIRQLGIKDNFFDLGGHSLLAVRLFAQIEKVTGMRLPIAALFQAPTIEQLAQLMSHQGWSAQWKSLVAIQPGGSRPPFFCVHAHDGGVLFWRDLARHLGQDQPFYALQAQGLDGRQPPHSRIEEMAAHYIKEIRTLQPEGPFYIGGHCIGGLVAFEMAQQLHMQDERVAFLALFDSFAPVREGRKRTSLLRRYRYRAIRLFERTFSLHVGNLSVLQPGEKLPYIRTKFNKALYKLYMGLGSRWIPAARNRRNILKAGSQAAAHYAPRSYPGKITLFRATDLGGGIERDPQMGWTRLASGGVETHLIPGYHAHTVLEPRVRLLAKELIASLFEAQEIMEANSLCEKSRPRKRAVRASWAGEISA